MFSDLKTLLQSNNFYNTVELKQIHKSTCEQCTINVLDFNSFKALLFQGSGNTPPAMNAITFDQSNKLFFIATESFYSMTGGITLLDFGKNIINGDLSRKMDGTIETLSKFLLSINFSPDNFLSFFKSKGREKIKTLILTDMSDRDFTNFRLSTIDLLNISSFSHDIYGEIVFMTCAQFENHFQ